MNALPWKLKNIDAPVYHKNSKQFDFTRTSGDENFSTIEKVRKLRRSVENLESLLHRVVENEIFIFFLKKKKKKKKKKQ